MAGLLSFKVRRRQQQQMAPAVERREEGGKNKDDEIHEKNMKGSNALQFLSVQLRSKISATWLYSQLQSFLSWSCNSNSNSNSNARCRQLWRIFIAMAALACLGIFGLALECSSSSVQIRLYSKYYTHACSALSLSSVYQYIFRPKRIIGADDNSNGSDNNGAGGTVDVDDPALPPKWIRKSVFGETDDLLIGKSCIYMHQKWVCRDCGLPMEGTGAEDEDAKGRVRNVLNKEEGEETNVTTAAERNNHQYTLEYKYKSYLECPVLKPRGKCPPSKMHYWDEPQPRSSSTYDPFSSSGGLIKKLTRHGVKRRHKDEYIQAQCSLMPAYGSGGNSAPCFDLDVCRRRKRSHLVNATSTDAAMEIPMRVYPIGPKTRTKLKQMMERYSTLSEIVVITDDPSNACLYYSLDRSDTQHAISVSTSAIQSGEQQQSSYHWNNGRNHFVKPRVDSDQPFDVQNYGLSAIMIHTQTDQHLRGGYDISIPYDVLWKVPDHLSHVLKDIHRPRKYLLSFRGTVMDTLPLWQQHRWIAAEYWWHHNNNDAPGQDVIVDVQCSHKNIRGKKIITQGYDNGMKNANSGSNKRQTEDDVYSEYLLHATFGFCPGGSGVSSFRFGEVLRAGGIPILVPGTVPPLHPEVNWSKCVVTVSEARIVDLPRLLRSMSPDEVRERQVECQRLYSKIFATTDGMHVTALRIWVERLRVAIDFENRLEEMADMGYI